MCRMAAYLGPSIRLQQFLLQPEHSLVVQRSEERRVGKECTYRRVWRHK